MKKSIVLALCIIMMLSLVSCGGHIYRDFEFNSNAEFAEFIGNYNSMHDLYVDTFMSFDLDGNKTVTKSIYYAFTVMPLSAREFVIKNGYICDIHGEGLAQSITMILM
ncbi:MAG: hypothetical protein ACI3XL_04020 [Eubacteriales bacterium]